MEELTTFNPVGSGYIYTTNIGGHRIEARITRVKETPDRLKAEVGIFVDRAPIARSNPVLTSVSGLDSFWRKLNRRLPKEDWGIDWESYTEELAARVIDAHREGEPEIVLSNVQIPTTVAWQIEPMLLAGMANVIYGPGGSGKSMIGLWLSVLMDTAHVDSKHDLKVEPGRVLYCDWETDQIEVASRVRELQAGMGLNGHKSQILYRRCTQSLANEADHIKDIVDKNDVKMIVIDSLGLATGGGLDEAESVLSYFGALRWIGITSLTITHTNKEGHLFGSVYTLNCGRSIWEVKKNNAEGEENIDVGLWHKKVNVVAKQKARAIEIEFGEGLIAVTAKDPMDSEVVSENLSVAELVYLIVSKEGPIEKASMSDRVAEYRNEAVDKVRPSVATAISRHLKAGRIVEIDSKLAVQARLDDLEDNEWEI